MYYQELLDDFVDMCREIIEKADIGIKSPLTGITSVLSRSDFK